VCTRCGEHVAQRALEVVPGPGAPVPA
jgi:hypothetical protein